MRRSLGLVGLFLLLSPPAFAQEPGQPPEALLAGDSIAYFRFDGLGPHRKSYDQTVLAEAMKGDLGNFAQAISRLMQDSVGAGTVKEKLLGGLPPEQLMKVHQASRHLPQLLDYLQNHGVVAGVELSAVFPPRAQLTVVFPQGGQPKHRDSVLAGLQLFVELNQIPITETTHAGRTIYQSTTGKAGDPKADTMPDPMTPRLAWWQEGEHIVLTFGNEKLDHTLTLVGDKPRANLTSNPLLQSVNDFKRYDTLVRGFIDLERGLEKARTLGPPAEKVINDLGLAGLKNLTFHTGFSGRFQQTSIALKMTGERKGVLRLIPAREVSFDRLPPLPPDAHTVTAISLDTQNLTEVVGLIAKVVKDVSGGLVDQDIFAEINKALGVDLRKDLLDALGSTAVLYSSPGEGFTFLGAGLAIEVKDPAKLQTAILALAKARGADEASIRKVRYQGVDIYTVRTGEQGFPITPSWAIHNGWLVAGFGPQTVKGHILRSSGRHAFWAPPPMVRETVAELKKNKGRVLAVSSADPRAGFKQLMPISLFFIAAINRGNDDGFDSSLIPHFQSVTEPLVPNVMALVDEGDALRLETKGSLPLPTDLLGIDSTFMLMIFGLRF
jgi:hypothetical protein